MSEQRAHQISSVYNLANTPTQILYIFDTNRRVGFNFFNFTLMLLMEKNKSIGRTKALSAQFKWNFFWGVSSARAFIIEIFLDCDDNDDDEMFARLQVFDL